MAPTATTDAPTGTPEGLGSRKYLVSMSLKDLERWWRRVWIRLLVGLMRRSPDGPPDWGARPHRVLFLRHDRAGDMILSTAAMERIARSHPTITLDVLASPANAAILEAADHVGEVIVVDRRRLASLAGALRALRRRRYDAVIDCMVTAPSVTTLLLMLASGARYRIGIADRGSDGAINVPVPAATGTGHMTEAIGALAAAFSIDPGAEDWSPRLTLTPAEREWAAAEWSAAAGAPGAAWRVLLNLSAGTIARHWPDERYVEVGRHLAAANPATRFLVIAAPAEWSRAQLVAEALGGRAVRTATIRHAFALVAAADFIFTPDTSIAHAASAFKRPCVAMYVRGATREWGLYRTPGRSIEHTARTLDDLPARTAIAAVDDYLAEVTAGR